MIKSLVEREREREREEEEEEEEETMVSLSVVSCLRARRGENLLLPWNCNCSFLGIKRVRPLIITTTRWPRSRSPFATPAQFLTPLAMKERGKHPSNYTII